MTTECLIKECTTYWRGPSWLFSLNSYYEQKKFMQIEAVRNILVLCQRADLYSFSKVFETYKSRMIIFTFTSQRRLLELPNYGEYNHLFTSVVCFLKTTHLSVHRFYSFNFFSWRIIFPHTNFLQLKNIDHSIRVLKTINNINLDQF